MFEPIYTLSPAEQKRLIEFLENNPQIAEIIATGSRDEPEVQAFVHLAYRAVTCENRTDIEELSREYPEIDFVTHCKIPGITGLAV